MYNFGQNVVKAARNLIKAPGFTLIAVLTLGLGIGVITAVFSVAHGILVRSLPFADPDAIVMVWENNPRLKLGVDKLPAAPADFIDWREQNKSFQDMATFSTFSFSLTDGEIPEKIDAVLCSASFFSVLGSPAAKGRVFAPGEDKEGNNHVAVISDNLWRRRFGADPNMIGKSLTLTGKKYEVIGIMPPGFDFPQNSSVPDLGFTAQTDLWIPLVFDEDAAKDRRTLSLPVIARLKPGVTLPQAQADMSAIAANIDQQYKKSAGFGTTVMELREQMVGDYRLTLWVLLGTAAFVLVIACSNIANLLLVWFLQREREFAIRTALGATRGQLIGQMLIESILLAVAGGVLGLLLAKLGTSTLLAINPDSIPRVKEIGLNGWVLGFSFIISLLTGMLTGLIPALQASRTDLNSTLKEEARGTTFSARSRQIRGLLTVSQVALTLVLLIGAGLLIRSFWLLQHVKLGFNPDSVLTMQMALPNAKYPEEYQRAEVINQMVQRVSALPGVESAAFGTSIPLSGSDVKTSFEIAGRPPVSPQDKPLANITLVTPDFFKMMQIPLVNGRTFAEQDTDKVSQVAIINQAMAKNFWPNESPLGARLTMTLEGGKIQREIVGVVGDVRSESLNDDPKPAIYVPYAQRSASPVYLAMRTKTNPLSLVSSIRKEVLAVDRDQPVYDVKSMNRVVWDSSAKQNFNMLLLTLLGALALVLAMIGVYGVVASSSTQRTHEVGIRMALGAKPSDILKLFLRQGLVLILAGLGLGLVVAFGLTRIMESLLYRINATDPGTFILVVLALIIIFFVAIFIPARRAAKLEPMIALRE
jgi:putative ABC transport system permease protein